MVELADWFADPDFTTLSLLLINLLVIFLAAFSIISLFSAIMVYFFQLIIVTFFGALKIASMDSKKIGNSSFLRNVEKKECRDQLEKFIAFGIVAIFGTIGIIVISFDLSSELANNGFIMITLISLLFLVNHASSFVHLKRRKHRIHKRSLIRTELIRIMPLAIFILYAPSAPIFNLVFGRDVNYIAPMVILLLSIKMLTDVLAHQKEHNSL